MIRRTQGKAVRILLAAGVCACMTRPVCAEQQGSPPPQQAGTQENAEEIAPPVLPQVNYEAEALREPFPPAPERKPAQNADLQAAQQAAEKPIEIKPPALAIQGIIWGGALPQAIVNGKVVKVGDTIEEATITGIDKEGIEIVYKDQPFHLASPSIIKKDQAKDNTEGGAP